jgi:aryl-alcohol dehydrogenase-like predicted oxidoreductase
MTRDTTFPDGDWRKGYFNPKNLNATLDRVDRLREDLPSGMTLPELAIRFILSNPVVSTIIVGMRKEEHVRGNLALSDAAALDADVILKMRKHRWDRSPAPWSD